MPIFHKNVHAVKTATVITHEAPRSDQWWVYDVDVTSITRWRQLHASCNTNCTECTKQAYKRLALGGPKD